MMFKVTVNRTETRYAEIEVDAANAGDAIRLAYSQAGNVNFLDKATVGDPEYDVVHVQGECGCTLQSECEEHLSRG